MTERPDDVVEEIVSVPASIRDNTAQEMIRVTRDKVELALRRNLPRYVPTGEIVGLLGLLVALVTALVTADFKDLGLDSQVWRGIFLLAAVASLVYLIVRAVKWIRRPSMHDLVESIAVDDGGRTK